MSSGQECLSLRGVAVGYKKHGRQPLTVLAGITGSVHGGELVGLVGPNGAGKSTLLRSVAHLQPLLAGSVLVDGEPTRGMNQRRIAKQMSVVLTDRILLGRLRVRDIVGLGRHPYSGITGRLSAEDYRIIEQSLAAVGAEGLLQCDFGELSDGQRQRVMVARALAQEPRCLLLDEPTAFLDPPGRVALLRLLRRVCTDRQIAVLVCTHDIETVLRYADTLWVAGRDTEVRIGGPEDLAAEGVLASAFATEGVTFHLDSLCFGADEPDALPVRILGDDADALLAAHALRRAGFRCATAKENPALVVAAGARRWHIQYPVDEVLPSLTQLHRAAAAVRESMRRKMAS